MIFLLSIDSDEVVSVDIGHVTHGKYVVNCSKDSNIIIMIREINGSAYHMLILGSGPLLRMAGYLSLQGIGINLLKYRWCYELVQTYGTKLEQNACTIGGPICG